MACIGIVLHHDRPQAAKLARETIDWLGDRHGVRVLAEDAAVTSLEEWSTPEDGFADGLDLVVSIGGDGTMLRTAEVVCGSDTPILGVNVGHLGYLSEVEPPGLIDALERFLAGAYSIEERMTLQVTIERAGHAPHEHVALNDAVVEKTAPGHTVRLAVSVNEEFFTTYAADGLIVATPTGSTAYNMSARGPIVSPRHRALLLTPVAPHMLFDRTMVRDPSDVIRLDVEGRAAQLSIDGRSHGELVDGDAIVCTGGAHAARLVRFGERDFLGIVKHKFGLADR